MTPRRPTWWAAVEALPPAERDALVARLVAALPPIRLRYSPYVPLAKQEAFLRLAAIEGFYGGAAGPGKSTTLLMAALQYADVPGYAALLLRRTYGDLALPGALMDMAKEWLAPTDARWNAGTKTWHFPRGGTLTFGHLMKEEDKRRYASSAFQFIGFDELTQFTESQYTFLFSRLRKPRRSAGYAADGATLRDVPLRMRAASNPGGPGHEWVRRRLVNAKTRRAGAVFMPALLSENPHIDADAYLESLSHLSEIERMRLVNGDWSAKDAGTVFDTSRLRVVDDADLAELGFGSGRVRTVRAWDFAATEESPAAPDPDWTVGARVSLCDATGLWLVDDVVRGRWSSSDVERQVAATARADGRTVAVWLAQEPGSAGKAIVHHYARTVLRGFAVHGWRESGDKETRARIPAAAMGNGLVVVREAAWVEAFVDEVDAFPHAGHDDQVDALSLAWHAVSKGGTMRIATPPPAMRLGDIGAIRSA